MLLHERIKIWSDRLKDISEGMKSCSKYKELIDLQLIMQDYAYSMSQCLPKLEEDEEIANYVDCGNCRTDTCMGCAKW